MLGALDIWRCAIVRQPASSIIRAGVDAASIVWLPDMPRYSFRADPFGLWRDGHLHVFAEAFDYRNRHGHIDLLVYDGKFDLVECRTILRESWHLSYPIVFEAEGETWMLPEACQSGTLTLYRARKFPAVWQAVCRIALDGPAIDATPVWHDGRWWMFYAPSHHRAARSSHLHVAWSERLTGPWRPHPRNPVRVDPGSARPGGTARSANDRIVLPVQDCRSTYGAAIRELSIGVLDETRFEATAGPSARAPAWMEPFTDGLHTLSAAGPVTLIDVKLRDRSLGGKAIDVGGRGRRRVIRGAQNPGAPGGGARPDRRSRYPVRTLRGMTRGLRQPGWPRSPAADQSGQTVVEQDLGTQAEHACRATWASAGPANVSRPGRSLDEPGGGSAP